MLLNTDTNLEDESFGLNVNLCHFSCCFSKPVETKPAAVQTEGPIKNKTTSISEGQEVPAAPLHESPSVGDDVFRLYIYLQYYVKG